MRRHKISNQDVELCLSNPDWVEPSIENRYNAWFKIGEKFLRITYKEEIAHIVIISAVFKKNAPRR